MSHSRSFLAVYSYRHQNPFLKPKLLMEPCDPTERAPCWPALDERSPSTATGEILFVPLCRYNKGSVRSHYRKPHWPLLVSSHAYYLGPAFVISPLSDAFFRTTSKRLTTACVAYPEQQRQCYGFGNVFLMWWAPQMKIHEPLNWGCGKSTSWIS